MKQYMSDLLASESLKSKWCMSCSLAFLRKQKQQSEQTKVIFNIYMSAYSTITFNKSLSFANLKIHLTLKKNTIKF